MTKILTIILFAMLAFAVAARASLTPVDLRCDYTVDPLGVDSVPPRLFWKVASNERGQRQTAYEIVVKDVWDSGKIVSDQTTGIPFSATGLRSNEQLFWKVRVWDVNGQVSDWSPLATWTMGVLSTNEWHANWIGSDKSLASTRLRRAWVVKPGLTRGLINVCGLGQYELTLNGTKVGHDWLSPGWSKYDCTCLYDTRDITTNLYTGTNAVGLLLGNGMYNVLRANGRYTKFRASFGPQTAIAQIRLEYSDGHTEIIGTDNNWRVAPGPITFSSIYGGEDFDARLVASGWDQPGFDDSSWPSATILAGTGGQLKGLSYAAPPIRAFETHRPVVVRRLPGGNEVFDLGQNAAHIPTLEVTGPAGSRVGLLPAELTNTNGIIMQNSMGTDRQNPVACVYTKATDGVEEWTPKFFYSGCRYYQSIFLPAAPGGELPGIESLSASVVGSASDSVGEFACSNDLFNRIHTLVRWAQRSNMMSVMTDCPHRERLGWLEEDHLNGPSLRYEFDLARLFTKTMNDIADSQLTNGLVPTTAPEYALFLRHAIPITRTQDTDRRNDLGDSPEWSSAFILVPWQQYEFDGDLDLFRQHFAAQANYLAYLGSRAQDYIVDYGLGDWYDLGPKGPGYSQLTPAALTATAFYFQDVTVMARVAGLLGKTDEATKYQDLAGHIRTAFNARFYNATNGSYATNSQCANSLPLVMGLCEPANRAAVLAAIVTDVQKRGLTTGDVGYRYLLRALAEGGRSDVIFAINNQSEKPGYGYQLKQGATSLTESWNADPNWSQNHFMLGQIMEWFYHDLGGISGDPDGPGFQRIIINPQPVGDVTWAKTSYDSIHGKIVCHWVRTGAEFRLQVTIPANTTATVFMPARPGGAVREGGRATDQAAGVKFLRSENGRQVYTVASGDYDFQAEF